MRKDYVLARRRWVVVGFIVVIAVIYAVRLFNIQVLDSKYKDFADNNAFLSKAIYPARGIIRDRQGKLLVINRPAYDVMLIPKDVKQFDSIDFCRTINITQEELRQRFTEMRDKHLNPGYSSYTPQTLLRHLGPEEYGKLQEKIYRFPGFYVQQRVLREYNYDTGANFLGNIREVSATDLEKDSYYAAGDYTGDLGVERSYEKYLRGQKGVEILIRDAHGQIQGQYDGGKHDRKAVSGKDLKLSINIDLQQYAESLMVGKKGAVVAIEPATGEILCLVSSPTYSPSLLVGRDRGKNYKMLSQDPDKPLFDRAIQAAYPPGSTFKPTQALVFLQEGIITPGTPFPCHHGYSSGRLHVGCHGHASPLALVPALATSCNAYFCYGFKAMIDRRGKYGNAENAFETWKNHLVSMGYGYKLGVDLPGEYRGFLPNAAFYDDVYGNSHWSANTIISDAIGQGEILATPLQIANLASTIANGGWFITPHVVKEIEGTPLPVENVAKHTPTVSASNYNAVRSGMRQAVLSGTCRGANIPGIEVCGKTGTAQNPHGRDHSAFMGFAPYANPKIAVAVYVENAGFGATFGVPIGSLVMEKYLNGQISESRKHIEENMLHTSTYHPSTRKH